MADRVEVVPLCNPRPQLNNFIRSELDDSSAPAADHVIMRGFSERMLVVGLLDVKAHLFEDAAVNKQRQCAIERRLAHFFAPFSKQIKDLLGLEVLMDLEHRVQNLVTHWYA